MTLKVIHGQGQMNPQIFSQFRNYFKKYETMSILKTSANLLCLLSPETQKSVIILISLIPVGSMEARTPTILV